MSPVEQVGLSRSRVTNGKSILEEQNTQYQPRKVYDLDEWGFPLRNRTRNNCQRKGKREIVSLTNVKRYDDVTVVRCFIAAGTYVPPMIIVKGARRRSEFQDGLAAGNVVEITDSGWINEDLFLVREI